MYTRSQASSQSIELTSSRGYDEDEGIKRKVPVRFYLLILLAVLVVVLVGLSIGLYFIGVSSGVASVSTLPTPSGTPNLGYRLPRVATPSHYKLTLFPNFYLADESQFTFQGWEIITFKPTVLTDRIFLHGLYLNVHFDSLQLYESQNLPDTEEPLPWAGSSQTNRKGDFNLVHHVYHDQFQFYELIFDKTLLLRDYKLKLAWTGPLKRDMEGLYVSKYTESDKTNYVVGSQLESVYARKAFPCFDEPDFKAVFETRLVRDPTFLSISNNEFIRSEDVQIEYKTYKMDLFLPTVIMSSYLNAFAVHQYAKLEDYDEVKNISYRFWGRKNWINRVEYVRSITKHVLSDMDKKYGTTYPFTKMDFYPLTEYAWGAMENWGLVTYAESTYYYDPNRDPLSVKERVASVTAHEIGHMNFGNIVTTKWWDDIWLNEGFASYFEYIGVDSLEPDWDYEDRFLLGTVLRAMKHDCKNATIPLTQQVETPSEIISLFGTIAYAKGGSICRMMSGILSESTFTNSLKVYLNTFQYQNAVHKNLFDALTAYTKVENNPFDMNAIMQGWTLQPGYPVITGELLSKTGDSLTIRVSQAPFELDKGKFGSRIWSIPINTAVSGNPNILPTLNWLHKSQDTITIKDNAITSDWSGWYVLNPDHTGYYRVSYNAENWQRLTAQLFTNHTVFKKTTRLQLVDDALNLARGNYSTMRYPQALSLLSYLCKDIDYPPWQATLDNIDYLEQMYTQQSTYGIFKTYGKILINNAYEFVGWQGDNTEPTSKHALRKSVLSPACRWGNTNCITTASHHFNQWKTNTDYILPMDGRSTALCYGIKNGTMEDWWWLYDQYKGTALESDRNNYIRALGCSDNETLLQWFLDVSIDNPSNAVQEFGTIYAAVAANPTSRKIITEYFYNKWNTISKMLTSVKKTVLESTFQYVNTDAELQRLLDWKKSVGILEGIENDYNTLVLNIGINIVWLNEHGAEVTDWFKAFNEKPTLPEECNQLK